jgi:hypothetical protein
LLKENSEIGSCPGIGASRDHHVGCFDQNALGSWVANVTSVPLRYPFPVTMSISRIT